MLLPVHTSHPERGSRRSPVQVKPPRDSPPASLWGQARGAVECGATPGFWIYQPSSHCGQPVISRALNEFWGSFGCSPPVVPSLPPAGPTNSRERRGAPAFPSRSRDSQTASRGTMEPWILLVGAGIVLGCVSGHLYTSPESCEGRCGEPFSEDDECHCHRECGTQHSCCEDYERHCGPGGEGAEGGARSRDGFSSSRDSITEQELLELSEQLYRLDHNKARPGDIAINPQHLAGPDETGDKQDRSPQPLYKYVNEALFSKPTYASFIKLLDNYQRATGREEEVTAEELREQDRFLQEVMKTELMKKLFVFLQGKNRYSSEEEFVQDLKEMWFGLYSRGDGERDSSGFEHVFSGEVKKGKVSGFHNWIRFYLLEKQGGVNYFSHNFNGPWDTYPDVLGLQFSWDGFYKEVGSAFIGCSPEFEFGLYSLCFLARPGRACHLSLGGHRLSVQTYPWTKSSSSSGRRFIATAYVMSP
ncbi:uridylate-specific endoribonuclease [Poecile atricapillus]|uniref:uridylate-specific endoribonuclease n=1 Tax=Poecile atricapillus TaxID=48891 RepID=UPI002739244E|nr:uridylate-specific endoribonuclease [Poecile atricapillus]